MSVLDSGPSAAVTPFVDQDLAYGNMLGPLINPPDQNAPPMKANAIPQPPPTPPQQASNVAPVPVVQPKAPTPAATSTTGRPQNNWAKYVQQGLTGQIGAVRQQEQDAAALRNSPTLASQNAPLEALRTQAAQPIPYRDPNTGKVLPSAQQYKPSIGSRIARGVKNALVGLAEGGPIGAALGAGFPGTLKGTTPYGAPNARYQQAETARQNQVASLDQQMKENETTNKADQERAKELATEQKDVTSGYGNVAKGATDQQNADTRAQQETDTTALNQQKETDTANAKNKPVIPKTYEQAVISSLTDPDPVKRREYAEAAARLRETEIKKFSYADRAANGGAPDDKRQAMIDDATEQVQKLNNFSFDPSENSGAGGFFDPSSPNRVYTPQQFVQMKNQISTKLDAALTKAKFKPLGVRFTVQGSTPTVNADGTLGPPQGENQPPAQTAPANNSARTTQTFTLRNGGGKQLTDRSLASQYLQKAGGDKAKARELARKDNWKF